MGFLWDASAGVELRDAAAASQESWPGNGLGKPTAPSPYLARFKVPTPLSRGRSTSSEKENKVPFDAVSQRSLFALILFTPGVPLAGELIQGRNERDGGGGGGSDSISPSGQEGDQVAGSQT